MMLFPLRDQAALSGTGVDLLFRLVCWRICQTLGEASRAHTLLMSQFAGGGVDVHRSICSAGKQLMICTQQEGPERGRRKEGMLQNQELQFRLGFS